MTDPTAVLVDELSKRYTLGLVRHDRLGERLIQWRRPPGRDLWALKDVSLQIAQGEVVGLVGRNGAGKSTLLRILSRITSPTTGRATLRGRVGSLLEVGTGFHPDLTGRENIYLNGAILGMSRTEVRDHFDEIVTFSELSKFLDTPVKRYSSGMYVRLAFAVAAHLRADILLVDEVLAVGDASFRSKSLNKMNEVSGEGRTVVFVSHDLGAISTLCERAYWLEGGRIASEGEAADVVESYLASVAPDTDGGNAGPGWAVSPQRLAESRIEGFEFRSLEIENPAAPHVGPRTGDPLTVRVGYRATRTFLEPGFVVHIRDHAGAELVRFSTMPISGFHVEAIEGDGEVELIIDALPATGGRWHLDLAFTRAMVEHRATALSAAALDVTAADVYGSGFPLERSHGMTYTPHHWEMR